VEHGVHQGEALDVGDELDAGEGLAPLEELVYSAAMNDNDLRSGKCPSCGHHEIIEAWPAEFGRISGELNQASTVALPLALTHQPRTLNFETCRDRERPFGALWV
jgi:hypothetical protein